MPWQTKVVIWRNRWNIHQWLKDHPEYGMHPCLFDSKSICECHFLYTREVSRYPLMMANMKEAMSWTDSTPTVTGAETDPI
jgi:hypothetical protein